MQIPKSLFMICVAALGLSTLQAQKADTVEQSKARELLRKKLAEPTAGQPASAPPAATKQRQNSAPATASAAVPATNADTPSLSPSDEAKLRKALHQKMAKLDSQDPAKSVGPKPGFDPLASPAARIPIPPAVSSAKEQKLSELLTLYRANVISPEQYQIKRAEILAQP